MARIVLRGFFTGLLNPTETTDEVYGVPRPAWDEESMTQCCNKGDQMICPFKAPECIVSLFDYALNEEIHNDDVEKTNDEGTNKRVQAFAVSIITAHFAIARHTDEVETKKYGNMDHFLKLESLKKETRRRVDEIKGTFVASPTTPAVVPAAAPMTKKKARPLGLKKGHEIEW